MVGQKSDRDLESGSEMALDLSLEMESDLVLVKGPVLDLGLDLVSVMGLDPVVLEEESGPVVLEEGSGPVGLEEGSVLGVELGLGQEEVLVQVVHSNH